MRTSKVNTPEKSKQNKSYINSLRDFFNSKTARLLVLTLFVFQATVLALVINPGTPPDEENHWQHINFYANHSLSPFFSEQEPTYNLGDKTREPDYLYHYLMSLVVRVVPFSSDIEHTIIRLFSVVIGVLSFIFLAKVFSKLRISEAITTATILMLSQLSMVLFISSVINNDALVWLGMTVGLWLLLKIWENAQPSYVLGLLLIPAYGGLLKRTLLPISLTLLAVAAVLLWKQRKSFKSKLKAVWTKPTPLIIMLALVLLLGIGLSAERIGGNTLRYGKIAPSCEDVQGEKACYGFWLNIRTRALAERPPERQIPTPEFAARWTKESVKNVLDIQTQGWRHEVEPPRWLTTVSLLLLGIGIVWGVIYDGLHVIKKQDKTALKRLVVLAIGLAYIVSHLLANLSMYKYIHVFGIALNGRYTIAGLFPVVALVVFYWSVLLKRWPLLRIALAITVIGLLSAYSGFSLLVRNPQLFNG